jgi:(1->4)-alpha-D-glucan 1-alpha-D-glucosylmutase
VSAQARTAKVPSATYRLQITPDFTLSDAAQIADYLHALGVSHVYTSPLLRAAAGSQHGYDVVGHDGVGEAIGGEAGRLELVQAAKREGLGVVVDIVPNHVGVADASENAQWWDVLKFGQSSQFAPWFDVEWAMGRILLPVLGDDADLSQDLKIESDELRYYEHRFPIAPGTMSLGDSPKLVHDRQHYRLAPWREANDHQSYRRFFAVSTLAGLRVEDPDVFQATHRLFAQWVADGEVDGLRVDHPDGLADPLQYLIRLSEAAPNAWIVVEKILEAGERLPESWPVDGTTGYDALAEVGALLVDPAGSEQMTALDARISGPSTWAQYVEDGKRGVATGILHAEVLRLARLAPSVPKAADALAELAIAFPVYRSYLPEGAEPLEAAVATAKSRRPELSDALDALLPRLRDPADEMCVRFQQTTGPIMAKGVEDTAYYRYARLIALNEVGGEPGAFGSSLAQFHSQMTRRQSIAARSMTTLSTHDTKRSEDVRARIAVLAEMPGEWAGIVGQLMDLAPVPDPAFGHLLWQTLVGIGGPRDGTRDRMHEYVVKAMREESTGTDWADPNEEFEAAIHSALDAAYDDQSIRSLLSELTKRIDEAAWANALSQKLIQLTMPGAPDIYQGTELWDDSLVDPDNRRPVDYARRRAMLADLDAAGTPPPVDGTGAAKLWLVHHALIARRSRPETFVGYEPLSSDASGEHLVAFDRGGSITVATRLPLALAQAGGWGDATLALPSGNWVDRLTGRAWSGSPRISELLSTYPVALLHLDSADGGS